MVFSSSLLAKTADGLSDEAFKYLHSFMNNFGMRSPTQGVAVEISKYRPNKPYPHLYRALGFWPTGKYGKAHLPNGNWVLGSRIGMTTSRPTSWTTDLEIAKDFGEGTHEYWVIVRLDNLSPDLMLCDTNLIPEDYRYRLFSYNQKEIILQPGILHPVVHEIGKEQQSGFYSTGQWGLA